MSVKIYFGYQFYELKQMYIFDYKHIENKIDEKNNNFRCRIFELSNLRN